MFRYHPVRIPKPRRLPRKSELDADYQGEVRELTSLYIQRGVEPALARQVAEQLMAKDATEAHAREELGLTDVLSARPLQAALFSAVSFSAGAGLPLIVALLSPAKLISISIFFSTLFHWLRWAISLPL